VPEALRATAVALNQEVSSEHYHLFGVNNEFINVSPLFTDATDYYVHISSNLAETICVNFYSGREEPEFFISQDPIAGRAFAGDQIQWKLRFEFGIGISEFRFAVKNVVAG
jgi:hypothetical protein